MSGLRARLAAACDFVGYHAVLACPIWLTHHRVGKAVWFWLLPFAGRHAYRPTPSNPKATPDA